MQPLSTVEGVSDEAEAEAAFEAINLAQQRVALRLAGMDLERLEFDRWRMANGRDPELGSSERPRRGAALWAFILRNYLCA
ncbi:MAG TPA: hypothetical protein VIU62_05185 [Chloroflexota bacterium]